MGMSTDHTHAAHAAPASRGCLQNGMVAGQRRAEGWGGGLFASVLHPAPTKSESGSGQVCPFSPGQGHYLTEAVSTASVCYSQDPACCLSPCAITYTLCLCTWYVFAIVSLGCVCGVLSLLCCYCVEGLCLLPVCLPYAYVLLCVYAVHTVSLLVCICAYTL